MSNIVFWFSLEKSATLASKRRSQPDLIFCCSNIRQDTAAQYTAKMILNFSSKSNLPNLIAAGFFWSIWCQYSNRNIIMLLPNMRKMWPQIFAQFSIEGSTRPYIYYFCLLLKQANLFYAKHCQFLHVKNKIFGFTLMCNGWLAVKLGSLSTGHLIQNSAPSQTTTKLSTIKGFPVEAKAAWFKVRSFK